MVQTSKLDANELELLTAVFDTIQKVWLLVKNDIATLLKGSKQIVDRAQMRG